MAQERRRVKRRLMTLGSRRTQRTSKRFNLFKTGDSRHDCCDLIEFYL